MDYRDFIKQLAITPPSRHIKENLIEGLDSIHFVVCLGAIKDDRYEITISEEMMQYFCDIVELVERRGAVKDKDYFIGGEKTPRTLTLGIHTTHSFLSDEDLDVSIRRYYSK